MLHPRARTMLLLSIPAIIIGIASSLVLIVAMKVAAILQNILWTRLPASFGINASAPVWTIALLTCTGIAVGLVVRFSPGHAGPDPATESLIGAPVSISALPGLLTALILGLAGGVSLGPEYPIMVINIAWQPHLVPDYSRELAPWTGRFLPPQAPLARYSVLRLRLRSSFRKRSIAATMSHCGIGYSHRCLRQLPVH